MYRSDCSNSEDTWKYSNPDRWADDSYGESYDRECPLENWSDDDDEGGRR